MKYSTISLIVWRWIFRGVRTYRIERYWSMLYIFQISAYTFQQSCEIEIFMKNKMVIVMLFDLKSVTKLSPTWTWHYGNRKSSHSAYEIVKMAAGSTFSISHTFFNEWKIGEEVTPALTIYAWDTTWTTGKIWLNYPQNINYFPPNGRLFFINTRNELRTSREEKSWYNTI